MKVSKELKVGFFMVFSIAILYIGFNYLKGIDFFSTNDKYYVVYANVDGLNKSNPVLISGFAVGRVNDIRLLQNNNDNVLVELDINSDIVLGEGASATLSSDVFGGKSILLKPGNISKPIAPKDSLIAILDKGIIDKFAESAQPVANNIEATIKKINSILDQFEGNGQKINNMVANLEKTPVLLNATILQSRQNLAAMTSTFKEVGTELNTTLKASRPLLTNLTEFTDSLKNLELQVTLDQTNQTLMKLNDAIEQFSQKDGTLGKLVNEDSLYVNINTALESLDKLLIHIDTAPKHFFGPLGKSRKKIEKDRERASEEF